MPGTIASEEHRTEKGKLSRMISSVLKVIGIDSSQEQTLEEKLMEVAEREKMNVKRDVLQQWALLVYDLNRIHLYREFAKEMKFEDTPVHGTWTAARAEQYALGLLEAINDLKGKSLCYSRHDVNFKRPLYPGKRADWDLVGVVESDEGVSLNISAIDEGGKSIVTCPSVNFSYKLGELTSDEIIPFSSSNHAVARKKFAISPIELDDFYECLGTKKKPEIPMMYVASSIPSTLLDISAKKSGRPEGGYLSMSLRFFNKPDFGVFETIVGMSEEPRLRAGLNLYTFDALCIQNDKLVLKGTFKVYSGEKFDI